LSEERDERTQALERGRQLAAAILVQLEMFTRGIFNVEAGRKLDLLQNAFATWERETSVEFPDITSLPEFADPHLRPAPPNKNVDQYQLLRRQAELHELRNHPEPEFRPTKKTAQADGGGMWSGTLGI
jgi:hypothetical protein